MKLVGPLSVAKDLSQQGATVEVLPLRASGSG